MNLVSLLKDMYIYSRIVEKDAPDPPGCCGAKVKAVTSVWVMNAQGLEKQDISGGNAI